MYKDNDQYGKVLIKLNVLNTIFLQPFDDWLVLDPTAASCKYFLPYVLFLVGIKTENNIELYPYLPFISAFALNLTGLPN